MHKKKENMYFYRADGYVEREIDGVKMYRDATMAAGTWKKLPTNPIDRLLDHIDVLTNCRYRKILLSTLHIPAENVTRIRKGTMAVPRLWLVYMAEYTGLTLNELYAIGGLEPTMPRFDAGRVPLALAA